MDYLISLRALDHTELYLDSQNGRLCSPPIPAAAGRELQEPENAPTPEQVQDRTGESPAPFTEAGLKARQRTSLETVK